MGSIHLPVLLPTLDVNTFNFCWYDRLYLALQLSAPAFPQNPLSFVSHNSPGIHNSLERPRGKLHQISHRDNSQSSALSLSLWPDFCCFPAQWFLDYSIWASKICFWWLFSIFSYLPLFLNSCLWKVVSSPSLKVDPSEALLPFPPPLEPLPYLSSIFH